MFETDMLIHYIDVARLDYTYCFIFIVKCVAMMEQTDGLELFVYFSHPTLSGDVFCFQASVNQSTNAFSPSVVLLFVPRINRLNL